MMTSNDFVFIPRTPLNQKNPSLSIHFNAESAILNRLNLGLTRFTLGESEWQEKQPFSTFQQCSKNGLRLVMSR
jgi:hypothetical protein